MEKSFLLMSIFFPNNQKSNNFINVHPCVFFLFVSRLIINKEQRSQVKSIWASLLCNYLFKIIYFQIEKNTFVFAILHTKTIGLKLLNKKKLWLVI